MLLMMMAIQNFDGAIVVGAITVFCIVSIAIGIVGLKRGAASMILSILGLVMALILSLGALLISTLPTDS